MHRERHDLIRLAKAYRLEGVAAMEAVMADIAERAVLHDDAELRDAMVPAAVRPSLATGCNGMPDGLVKGLPGRPLSDLLLHAEMGGALARLSAAQGEGFWTFRRPVVLVGVAGSGRASIARSLAHEMDMPLVEADVAAIRARQGGEADAGMTRIAEWASRRRCLLLLRNIDSMPENGMDAFMAMVSFAIARAGGIAVATAGEGFAHSWPENGTSPVNLEVHLPVAWQIEAIARRAAGAARADGVAWDGVGGLMSGFTPREIVQAVDIALANGPRGTLSAGALHDAACEVRHRG